MIEVQECPVCKSDRLSLVFAAVDHLISGDSFNIVECDCCHIRLTSPIPDDLENSPYYDSDDYISHSETTEGIINKVYAVARTLMLVRKRNLVQSSGRFRPGKLLEIGCGAGVFLNEMHLSGWEVRGIEPNKKARETVMRKYGLAVESIEEWFAQPGSSYDVIALWHVLEHLHNLDEYLRLINTCLKSDGRLILAVPNYYSFDADYYQAHWAAYDVPRHLYHFTYESMTELSERYGLAIAAIKQLPFDPFYVSILSEKYQEGLIARGLWIGLLSYLQALGNKKRSSSIIYVLKHKN
ncbi:class I SAM-dependent methyltransferase [Candidatus Neomarinimicrobiota bacterium]